jgi:hypothetical protein
VTSKPWWRSKTIQFNALAIVLLAALEMAGQNVQLLQPLLSPKAYAAVAFALPIVNIVLRKLTIEGIHFFAPPDQGAGGKV